jgi:FkbM family methyltransferase
MNVIDGGANIGQYTLLASTAVGPKGAVHTFEPLPVNFNRLRNHVLLNGICNVTLNRAALWRDECMLSFELPDACSGNNGAYRASAAPGANDSVPAVALDTYVARHRLPSVDLIKLDVEGSEPNALLGAKRTIAEHKPRILMEVNRSALNATGSSLHELWRIVKELGYHAWLIGSEASTSKCVGSFDHINQANVVLYADSLPPALQSGWTEKTCLAWAQSHW